MDLVRVAQKIRQLRESQGLTVSQLATKSSLSKAFISRLENFRINPSLNSLNRLTAALGISMSDFFNDDSQSPSVVFGKLDQGEPIHRNNNEEFGLKYFSLAYKKLDRVIDPFIIEYRPADKLREFLMHPNEEFYVVLEGSVDFYVGDMDNLNRMGAGDTVYLSPNVPHSVRLSEGCESARALTVYCQSADNQNSEDSEPEKE